MQRFIFILGCFSDALPYVFRPSRWGIIRLEMRTAFNSLFRRF